jgi:ubiquinone/menaquinone biosynthesis C-methylase UbiE
MGYVFEFQDARSYADWWSQQSGQWAAALELELMTNLLNPCPGETILDIGCGIGMSSRHLLNLGLNVTGIDPSPYMLDIALENHGNQVDLYRGFAEELPFDDNSFNHALFFLSLEFVNDPSKAIAEAFRVAKDRVFIGFFNRYALKAIQRMLTGFTTYTAFQHARYFSIWEVKKLARSLLGSVPITWRTVCHLPGSPAKVLRNLEQSYIVQQSPFGAFAGLSVTVLPKFRTRPLAMRYKPKTSARIIPGSAPVGSTATGRHQSNRN